MFARRLSLQSLFSACQQNCVGHTVGFLCHALGITGLEGTPVYNSHDAKDTKVFMCIVHRADVTLATLVIISACCVALDGHSLHLLSLASFQDIMIQMNILLLSLYVSSIALLMRITKFLVCTDWLIATLSKAGKTAG